MWSLNSFQVRSKRRNWGHLWDYFKSHPQDCSELRRIGKIGEKWRFWRKYTWVGEKYKNAGQNKYRHFTRLTEGWSQGFQRLGVFQVRRESKLLSNQEGIQVNFILDTNNFPHRCTPANVTHLISTSWRAALRRVLSHGPYWGSAGSVKEGRSQGPDTLVAGRAERASSRCKLSMKRTFFLLLYFRNNFILDSVRSTCSQRLLGGCSQRLLGRYICHF